ncbi:acyltransferase [Altererythrobacter sp. RZ02]|uniref:Acyltransferase n=1 Tax=Pontixanthobacter rizhaonensis TaxID=2730337 RepID=A0A848QQT0_9SPHN|nr:acyltransferase [Pontixanthobacter rizhaonensis]NMW32937.1 acyltransferase [Pontixanthobacter rizhaonensis]
MTDTKPAKKGIWGRARAMAEMAPPERNRYVDFLRALSILAVVVGHWLVAAPYIDESGAVVGGNLLGIIPWTQGLTWVFQVMPLFFLVGGFSNGVSWSANTRNNGTYSHWFSSRFRRLIYPVLPLFAIWTGIAMFGTVMGIERGIVAMAAQLALIPVWFLSVYIMVTAVVPLSHAAWKRWGMGSFFALVLGAVAVDLLTYQFGVAYLKYTNFAFVWLAVHQLGYAWGEGHFAKPAKALAWGASGLIALLGLVFIGPYPVAMIGVPGNDITNSMPPTIALLALGIMQTGFALALEPQARKMLDNIRIWTSVVLINGMIMSVYLWHLTAFVLVLVAAWMLGGVGLGVEPGTAMWWLARPVWFVLYIALTLPLVMLFARYEQAGENPKGMGKGDVPRWRLFLGLILACIGLASTAVLSIATPEGVLGVRFWIVVLPFIGGALVRFGKLYDWTAKRPKDTA